MKTSLKCVLILITLAVCAASSQSSTPPFALTLEAEENPVKRPTRKSSGYYAIQIPQSRNAHELRPNRVVFGS
jgi:hypothetical protein